MKIYFVRHGESILNLQEIHQNGAVPLSKEGLKQAKRAGKRLIKIPVDHIISSPFERAKQTAELIGDALGKQVEFSSLFVEIKRPTEIEGKSVRDPKVVTIKNKILENWHDPSWRHSDEETFYDIKGRAIEALTYLTTLKSENVVVVIHGEILRMLVSVMIFGEDLDAHQFKKMRTFLNLSNTGLTICEYEKNSWKLVTWNDHAHLKNALVARYKN